MGDLTKHFSLKEFIVSKEHPELLLEIEKNFTDQDRHKCYLLAKMFLEPLRETWKEPITILSGKRSPVLNTSIGGALHSEHLFFEYGAACDFTAPRIKEMALSLAMSTHPFGQMIWYPERHFIHISLPTEKHWRECLIKKGTKFFPYNT